MATGSSVQYPMNNVTSAPYTGNPITSQVNFGGSQVVQATGNIYLEVFLSDPTNTGAPASFEIQAVGGIGSTNNAIGTPITSVGLTTVTPNTPVTEWSVNLLSLTGGVAPSISVRGIAGL